AVLSLGMVLVWALAALVLISQGAGSAAYEDIFRYGRALATELPPEPNAPPFLVRWLTGNPDSAGVLPRPVRTTNDLVWWGTGTWPLWLLAIPAMWVFGFGRQSTTARRLVAAWTVSAWIQVALPRLFWAHYYLTPWPGLAVVLGVFAADCVIRIRSRSVPPRRSAFLPMCWLVLFV